MHCPSPAGAARSPGARWGQVNGGEWMKRDMELIRELLLYFESKPGPSMLMPADVEIPGHEPPDVHYHILLLCEAGFLTCERLESSTTPSRLVDAYPFDLSWAGHEFLDAARNDTLWDQAKRMLKSEGLTVGVGLLQALLVSLAKQRLSLT